MLEFTFDEERLNQEGYLLVEDAYDVSALRQQVYASIDQELEDGTIVPANNARRPKNVLRLPEVRRFITDPGLYKSVSPLFSTEPVLCSLGAFCVMPGGAGMGIHRDYPYFSRKKQSMQGAMRCLQMVLSLDGMDDYNGATLVYPNSHHGTLLAPVRLICPPGTLTLFHGAMMHGVESNRSAAPRTNLLASFSPFWVRAFSDFSIDRTPEELADPALRRLLGLDFQQRVVEELPYRTS